MDPLALLSGPALGGGGFSGSSSASADSSAAVGGGEFNLGGSTTSQIMPLLIVGAIAIVAVLILRKG